MICMMLMIFMLTNAVFSQNGNPPLPPDGKDFDIKVFLQGLYTGSGQMRQVHEEKAGGTIEPRWTAPIAEKLTVEIHTPGNYGQPSHVWARTEVILRQNGWIRVNLPETGSYYITIRTRNHLETVSAAPIDFSNPLREYNFTTGAAQAYGSNQIDLGGGVFGIYAGDVNQDGDIDINDSGPMILAVRSGQQGYVLNDITGDGYVDINDSGIIINNVRSGISAQTP